MRRLIALLLAAAAALSPACDRVVDLTPRRDASPDDNDGAPADDGGLASDALVSDALASDATAAVDATATADR